MIFDVHDFEAKLSVMVLRGEGKDKALFRDFKLLFWMGNCGKRKEKALNVKAGKFQKTGQAL